MAEDKAVTPSEAPESAEAAEATDTQVVESEASGKTETPAAAEEQAPVEPVEADDADSSDEDESVSGDGSDDAESAEDAPEARQRARRNTGVGVGIAHIRATFNNTLVSISDKRGGVISWSSAGRAGFKGSRKSTAFAATMVGQDAARQAVAKGMHEVEVHVQGAGSGRESAIRALQSAGLVVTLIKDVTPMPHNGCRQRKRRRV